MESDSDHDNIIISNTPHDARLGAFISNIFLCAVANKHCKIIKDHTPNDARLFAFRCKISLAMVDNNHCNLTKDHTPHDYKFALRAQVFPIGGPRNTAAPALEIIIRFPMGFVKLYFFFGFYFRPILFRSSRVRCGSPVKAHDHSVSYPPFTQYGVH